MCGSWKCQHKLMEREGACENRVRIRVLHGRFGGVGHLNVCPRCARSSEKLIPICAEKGKPPSIFGKPRRLWRLSIFGDGRPDQSPFHFWKAQEALKTFHFWRWSLQEWTISFQLVTEWMWEECSEASWSVCWRSFQGSSFPSRWIDGELLLQKFLSVEYLDVTLDKHK